MENDRINTGKNSQPSLFESVFDVAVTIGRRALRPLTTQAVLDNIQTRMQERADMMAQVDHLTFKPPTSEIGRVILEDAIEAARNPLPEDGSILVLPTDTDEASLDLRERILQDIRNRS